MSVLAVRDAIVARVSSVPEVGVVHNRERYAHALDKLKTLYWSAAHGQIRGWFLRRERTREHGQISDSSVEQIRWRLTFVMSFDDEASSELVFDDLIELVRDAFRVDDTLDGSVAQCSVPQDGGGSLETGLQLDDCGPAMFGGVLCHVARLGLTTIRYLEK